MRGAFLISGLVLVSVSSMGAVLAQTHDTSAASLQVTQDQDSKTKVKDDRAIVRDNLSPSPSPLAERGKRKPVRRALEEQYKKVAQAQINEDIEAMRALRTPDFSVDLPNGDRWDLEAALNYSRAGFQQVESNISLTNTIESLDVHETEAVAVVHQRWSRMQFKGGQLRRVDTEAIHTETWVNTKDGWKLKHIGNIKPGPWYVDGKRVDPTKP